MNILNYITYEKSEVPIYLGHRILAELKNYIDSLTFDKLVIITDDNVNSLWIDTLTKNIGNYNTSIFVVPN